MKRKYMSINLSLYNLQKRRDIDWLGRKETREKWTKRREREKRNKTN